ncbi:xyloglucan galactosyltransferase XLT2-like [Salvia splendens]|nr:xyloglucan galactosyltransferase XLT2-like [Salvia splendens]
MLSNSIMTALNSIKLHIFSSPGRICVFLLFLWAQFTIISLARTPTPCFPDRSSPLSVRYVKIPSPNTTSSTAPAAPEPPPPRYTADCPSGRVYAYDLPPSFNRDLVPSACPDLDPWDWQCGISPNHGYGRAASELRRTLPGDLHKSWYHTNEFTLELLFHHRILKHKCRTLDPDLATAFYIPFYAGLAVGKHLWGNDTSARDRHCELMLTWIKSQNYWKIMNGSDHFISIGRITWDFRRLTDPGKSWGSSFLNMPSMQRVIRFIIEKHPGDEMDVSVPYPTGFHPKTSDELAEWQRFVRDHKRAALFTFIGTDRNWGGDDLRRLLMDECRRESSSCRAVDCGESDCARNSSITLLPLLEAEFCLQPKSDSFTSRAVFECLVAGAVPVFFRKGAYEEQYEWFLPGEQESYSVLIEQEEVRSGKVVVKEVLERYGKEEIQRKRERVIEMIPRIIYSKPNAGVKRFRDAFDIAVDGAMERIKDEKEWVDFL